MNIARMRGSKKKDAKQDQTEGGAMRPAKIHACSNSRITTGRTQTWRYFIPLPKKT